MKQNLLPCPKLIVSIAALMTASTAVGDQIVFDNLASPTTSSNSISSVAYWAQGFKAPDIDSYLSAVTLNVRNDNAATGIFTVQLFYGLGSVPTLLATLSGPANPQSGLTTFVPPSDLPLEAGQTYWVSAYATSAYDPSQFYGWSIADNAPTVGTGYGRAFRQIGGGWDLQTGPGDLSLQVRTTFVPEPTTFGLLSASSILFSARRRRDA